MRIGRSVSHWVFAGLIVSALAPPISAAANEDPAAHAMADKFSGTAEEKQKAEQEAARLRAEQRAAREAELRRKADAERQAAERVKTDEQDMLERARREAATSAEKERKAAERKAAAVARKQAEQAERTEIIRRQREAVEQRRIAKERETREAEERRLAEQQKLEDARRLANERDAREAEERRLADQRKIEEDRRLAEERAARYAEERRIAEQRRLDDERRIATSEREARDAEERRIAEDRAARDADERQAVELRREEEAHRLAEKPNRVRERVFMRRGLGAKPEIYGDEDDDREDFRPRRAERDFARGPEDHATVLLIMEPGRRGIRRFDHSAEPILCSGPSCFISTGAHAPALEMPRMRALGPANTLGRRALACRHTFGCVFRDIDIGPDGTALQPVDMKFFRHDRREAKTVTADKSCEIESGRLHCANPVNAGGWRAWIVPESVANRAGPELLKAAIAAGLPDGRSALWR